MTKQYGVLAAKIATTAAFLCMILLNALANILPINGVTTGQVSDSYGNLFAPAGFTFAIWGLIYLLLAVFTLYQLGAFQGDRNAPALMGKVRIYFSISSAANAVWILCWHYGSIILSMAMMAIILVCLIMIARHAGETPLSPREKLLFRLPFSVYFGWITVATIANLTTLLVSWNWNGFGIAESTWTVIVLAAGLAIGAATMLKHRDVAYGLTLVWAYAGILAKHSASDGFAGRYPPVIAAAAVCIVLLLAAEAVVVFSGRTRKTA